MNKSLEYYKKRIVYSDSATRLMGNAAGMLKFRMRDGVFMFHQGRSGSSVLALLLDQNPGIVSFGEIFEPAFRRAALTVAPETLLRARRLQAAPHHALAEVKFFECQHLSVIGKSIEEFTELLKLSGYNKFIVLKRENYMKVLISVIIGIVRGNKYHYFSGEAVPETKFHIDPEKVQYFTVSGKLSEIFEYMDGQYDRLASALAGSDVLDLSYERDIAEDPKVAYGRVCDWLGVERVPVNVTLQRANTLGVRDVILNWSDVRDALSETRYAWMVQ